MSCIKQTVGFMAVFVATSAVAATTYAATVYGITWTYSVTEGYASVGGGEPSSTAVPVTTSGAIVIPSRLGGYAVKSIGSYAFYSCTKITSVTMPAGVTSIGSSAFGGCSGLTSVTIPDGVTSIGDYAFRYCMDLTSVTIPDSVTSIGALAFDNCDGLTSVTIPGSVISIGDSAFNGCDGLTSVTIGDGVTSIGAHAFANCDGLTSVMIPKSVTNIGRRVFIDCRGLMNISVDTGNSRYSSINGLLLSKDGRALIQGVNGDVVIPDGVTRIGDYAFYCSGLTSVAIPNSVTSIGSYAFESCSGLTSVTMPAGVTSIGDSAFGYCTNLKSVTIPDSVTSIGARAFDNCDGLTSVTIPSSVTNIGYYAFEQCSGLVAILVDVANNKYSSTNGLLLSKDGKTLIGGVNGDVMIPDGVTSIGDGAFSCRSGLTSVAIPNSVTNIGSYAFSGCSKLVSVFVPNGSSIDLSAIPSNATVKRYKPVQTVYFNVAGGEVEPGSVSVRWGDIYGVLPSPTRVGYSFSGWKYGNSVVVKNTIVTALNDHTLIAQWTPNRYVMTFDANGGVGGKTVTGNYGTSLSAPTVTRTGYTFVGWSPSVPSTVPAENATYTAQWQINQYTMTFDANGGVGGKTIVLDYGSPLSAPTVTRERHTFNGWSPSVPSTVPAGNATYTAQWLVNKYTVTFDANGGTCGTSELGIDYGTSVGELPVPVRDNAVFLGWFTEAEGGVKVDADTVVTGELVLYAHWLFEVESPVVVSSEGNPFRADSCEVSIECATEGAAIYYTDDGTTPRLNDDYLYTGPFTITDTTVIKAIAVFQELRSGYVTTTIEKHTLTFEEALGSVEGVAFATGGDALWSPIVYDAAKRGDICAKSGAIGNRAETWLSATVEGAGVMTFWCKTSCEHDEDNMFTWDRLMIYTNGVEIAEWRMDGETDWTERALSFEGGVNTVKWVYYKDRTGADGEDCAWVDAVTWTPSAAADPIPTVTVDADAATVNAAVDGVGFADTAVKAAIGGSATEYNAFKTWADGVKGTAGDALAGEAAVVANEHAAAAYLLGSERLFENEPTIEIGGLAIVDGESAGTTTMTVAVTVKDGESAVVVSAANVAAMFEATGDLGDWTGSARLTPKVDISGTDASGKMTFVVTPGDGTADRAFLRIKR